MTLDVTGSRLLPIVAPSWLAAHLDTDDDPGRDLVVCHVAGGSGSAAPQSEYLAGHLPGARFVSLDDALAAPPAPGLGRHPLPSPAAFAEQMGALGIRVESSVVAYDTAGGSLAARLVWMLRVVGQAAALLDGGLQAWTRELHTGWVDVRPVERPARRWPVGATADADAVAAHLAAGGVVIDSRSAERYAGVTEPIDAIAGHIPGAINLPFVDNLIDGRFKPTEELDSSGSRP